MIRDQYYGLLATARDEALARRALQMALTDEPGATNGAAMLAGVSREHPELALDFAIANHGDGWVVFENPAHDFPNRIEYRRDGAGLRASIAGPGADGKTLEIPFNYHCCGE